MGGANCNSVAPGLLNFLAVSLLRFTISRAAFNMSDAMKVARRFVIRGDVQGVGYRFFAQRAAARHQVIGYVRNCPDGTVEAVAEGSATDIEEFKKDLVTGPRWSAVEHVEEITVDPTGEYSSFRIER
jgi:acylphosphatase